MLVSFARYTTAKRILELFEGLVMMLYLLNLVQTSPRSPCCSPFIQQDSHSNSIERRRGPRTGALAFLAPIPPRMGSWFVRKALSTNLARPIGRLIRREKPLLAPLLTDSVDNSPRRKQFLGRFGVER